MNTKDKIHQTMLNDWAVKISNQKSSGLTVREWCVQNNVTLHKYNYWKHLLKEEYVSQALPDIESVPLSAIYTSPQSPAVINASQDVSTRHDRANCTNRTICTMVNLVINDVSISIESSVPEDFLRTLIKAVRYA